MSMHKKPLTPLEEEWLRLHRLPVGVPSQLADCFRSGVAWAEKASAARIASLEAELAAVRAPSDERLDAAVDEWFDASRHPSVEHAVTEHWRERMRAAIAALIVQPAKGAV